MEFYEELLKGENGSYISFENQKYMTGEYADTLVANIEEDSFYFEIDSLDKLINTLRSTPPKCYSCGKRDFDVKKGLCGNCREENNLLDNILSEIDRLSRAEVNLYFTSLSSLYIIKYCEEKRILYKHLSEASLILNYRAEAEKYFFDKILRDITEYLYKKYSNSKKDFNSLKPQSVTELMNKIKSMLD